MRLLRRLPLMPMRSTSVKSAIVVAKASMAVMPALSRTGSPPPTPTRLRPLLPPPPWPHSQRRRHRRGNSRATYSQHFHPMRHRARHVRAIRHATSSRCRHTLPPYPYRPHLHSPPIASHWPRIIPPRTHWPSNSHRMRRVTSSSRLPSFTCTRIRVMTLRSITSVNSLFHPPTPVTTRHNTPTRINHRRHHTRTPQSHHRRTHSPSLLRCSLALTCRMALRLCRVRLPDSSSLLVMRPTHIQRMTSQSAFNGARVTVARTILAASINSRISR